MTNSKGIQFIATTIIGGLLFLVPVVFLGFVLTKAVGFMMIIAEPMADFIPVDSVGGVALANLIAIVAVIIVSFFAGLIARNALASGFIKGLESKFLMKIPGYSIVKGIKGGFDKDENQPLQTSSACAGLCGAGWFLKFRSCPMAAPWFLFPACRTAFRALLRFFRPIR